LLIARPFKLIVMSAPEATPAPAPVEEVKPAEAVAPAAETAPVEPSVIADAPKADEPAAVVRV
jgi:hypothetical protein